MVEGLALVHTEDVTHSCELTPDPPPGDMSDRSSQL